MRNSTICILVYCAVLTGLASAQGGRESWGLRGRVRYVEQYETYFCCRPNQRKQGPRRLTSAATFDRKGEFIERVSITNTSEGPYYERHVFKFGRDGKPIGAEVFRSESNPPETYFEFGQAADGHINVLPKRAENLTEKITYVRDGRGRLTEMITRDRNEDLIWHRMISYDRRGRMIRVTVLKAGGAIDNESITTYSEDGRRSETIGIRPGTGPGWRVQKITTEKDSAGRYKNGEAFGLKEDDPKDTRYVRLNRSVHTYEGDRKKRLDWVFFKPDGSPGSKVVIVRDKYEEEVSRIEYDAGGPLPAGGLNEDLEPPWKFREHTIKLHRYDKRGNRIHTEWREQRGPELPMETTTIYERTIVYY